MVGNCTKGEWEVEQRGENCFVILGSERQVIAAADLVYRDRELAEKENLANANLIASAPDLYEALSSLVNRLAFYLQNTELELRRIIGGDYSHLIIEYKDALKALAKADGKDG